jgi:hypothetical protein
MRAVLTRAPANDDFLYTLPANWQRQLRQMKQLLLIVILFVLPGCASDSAHSDFNDVDKTQTLVLKCAKGFAQCYSKANEVCGSRGFEELDRSQFGHLTAAGRLDNQGKDRHVYREDLRIETDQQTLTFRCK